MASLGYENDKDFPVFPTDKKKWCQQWLTFLTAVLAFAAGIIGVWQALQATGEVKDLRSELTSLKAEMTSFQSGLQQAQSELQQTGQDLQLVTTQANDAKTVLDSLDVELLSNTFGVLDEQAKDINRTIASVGNLTTTFNGIKAKFDNISYTFAMTTVPTNLPWMFSLTLPLTSVDGWLRCREGDRCDQATDPNIMLSEIGMEGAIARTLIACYGDNNPSRPDDPQLSDFDPSLYEFIILRMNTPSFDFQVCEIDPSSVSAYSQDPKESTRPSCIDTPPMVLWSKIPSRYSYMDLRGSFSTVPVSKKCFFASALTSNSTAATLFSWFAAF